jgi:lysophospholipase L1-like esterase
MAPGSDIAGIAGMAGAAGASGVAGKGGSPPGAGDAGADMELDSGGDSEPSGQSGSGAAGGAGGAASAAAKITVWLAGDSTVANGTSPCPIGWGAQFGPLFDARVDVLNRAVGGRSVRTWLYDVQDTLDSSGECDLARDRQGQPTLQPRWQEMLDGMKSGDYLFIQFGINDSASTCNRHVGVEAFKASYAYMIDEAIARGAQPILITPVSSISCDASTARPSRAPYDAATREVASEHGVPLIDLELLSTALYQKRQFCPVTGGDVSASTTGPVGDFFCDDHTHFSASGARDIAGLVAGAIRDQAIPLASYLN